MLALKNMHIFLQHTKINRQMSSWVTCLDEPSCNPNYHVQRIKCGTSALDLVITPPEVDIIKAAWIGGSFTLHHDLRKVSH